MSDLRSKRTPVAYPKIEPAEELDRTVHSIHGLKMILKRERARTDRSGMEFSLLTLTSDQSDSNEAVLDFLVEIMLQRLRETDEIGWVADDQIGAVLPYTSPGSAIWLADEICNLLPDNVSRPRCEVFVYPSDSEPDQPSSSSQNHHLDSTETCDTSAGITVVRPMESLFIQAMPRWKRSMDIALSSIALVVLSPLLLLITIAIKLLSPGPILFKQKRTGLGGRVFEIFKFRTMSINAEHQLKQIYGENENDGPAFKMKRDPRITGIGRFLRMTSLDELPQFCNVLLGDMSLVGPRPLPCHESEACSPWQLRRLDVTPGITCIWQVSGRSLIRFDQWMRMDIDYVRSQSFLGDIGMLFRTVWAVASRRGAQ